MEENKAPNSVTARRFGAECVMFETHDLTDVVELLELGIGNEALLRRVRLCFCNRKLHFIHKSLLTSPLTRSILVRVRLIRRLI